MKFDVLFAVIAPREVEFFANIADIYRKEHGLACAFLTFFEPGDRALAARGFKVFSLHKESAPARHMPAEIDRLQKKYALSNLRSLLIHEKLTFSRFDEGKLLDKLVSYDAYFAKVLRENSFGMIVQELGAFIAPMSLYFNAKAAGVPHLFIEPSMYRGYVLFSRDAIDVELRRPAISSPEKAVLADAYSQKYHGSKLVVIPSKDRHHFMDAGLRKLFNGRNIKRLSEKLYYKYVRGEREEYDAIGNHVRRHLAMTARRRFLGGLYSRPDYARRYVYFPLHVPIDFQLTFREPKYLNQLYLAEYFSNVLPAGVDLYIKEHPASIGAYDYWALRKLLRSRNVKLVHPSVNSYDLIKHALCVTTINSKVGAEALLQGKRVYVLGRPYYLASGRAVKLNTLEDFAGLDFEAMDPAEQVLDSEFFRLVAENSYKGELYENSTENLAAFADSLKKAMDR